jgi:Domain of unknown function (DUF4189)
MAHIGSRPSAGRRRVLALWLAGAMLWPHAAAADGALAVGLPGDVAKEGVAMGWVINSENEGWARARALQFCLEFMDAPPATRALCKVIKTFRGECVAIALDPEAGTPGVGWAVAAAVKKAESDALAACVNTAGAERQKFCKVTVSRCDGKK